MKITLVLVLMTLLVGAAAGFYFGYVIGFEKAVKQSEAPDQEEEPDDQDAPTPYKDLIVLDSPAEGGVISSPLAVSGKARGMWFFEGSFPLVLVDWDGRIIAESFATAQGEWMTEDYVPFEGTIEFEAPKNIGEFSRRGALILQKDNPSGLPEFDDALEVPIRFRVEGAFKTTGTLKGRILVGPLCPVEPCQGEMPDVYSGLRVIATPTGGGRPVDLPFYADVQPDGTFRGELPESNYELTLNTCEWLGCQFALPKAVRVDANETTEVVIDIDTGIR